MHDLVPERPHPALQRLDALPRTPLGTEPTPLRPAPHLARALGLDVLLLKLDAHNGFALGGNKVRKLEFLLTPEALAGVTHLVTVGGVQSNHARVTAAAAAHLGLECVLVLNGDPPDPPRGNALLQRLYGAEVVPVGSREERDPAMAQVVARVEKQGGRALAIPLGASTPLGALGYVRAAREFAVQLGGGSAGSGTPSPSRTRIFISSSSCGTVAGLLLGLGLTGLEEVEVVAVSADVDEDTLRSRSLELARGAAALLGIEGEPPLARLVPDARWVGEGYGIASPESDEAAGLFGRRAGIVLDPVYTAKAGAALLGWIREGRHRPGDRAVFWHTGGHPALLV